MKHLVKVIIGIAGIFAAFCAFVGVVEHLCTRLSFAPEEGNTYFWVCRTQNAPQGFGWGFFFRLGWSVLPKFKTPGHQRSGVFLKRKEKKRKKKERREVMKHLPLLR